MNNTKSKASKKKKTSVSEKKDEEEKKEEDEEVDDGMSHETFLEKEFFKQSIRHPDDY